jgi:hydroxymethylpyrimidine/phosphomethylpyrimidine kinase
MVGFRVNDIASMKAAAEKLAGMGPKNVLIKGGHLPTEHEYAARRINTTNTHGTGCTYSAAITAEIAKGVALPDAVARAKTFITRAIQWAPGIGTGSGPLNHF